MNEAPDTTPPLFTRERLLTIVLGLLTLLILYVCYRIIEPFLPAIAFALALAVATQTPFSWLQRHLRKPALTAAIAVLLMTFLVLGPAAFLTTYIVHMVSENLAEMQATGGKGVIETLRGSVQHLPGIGPWIQDATTKLRLDEQVANLGRALASQAGGFVSGSIAVITQLGITMFVLFFLYRDCDSGLEAVRRLLPLSRPEADRLFARVGSTISATVNGSLTVALVQATLAGVVYWILGVPAAVLWGALTFLAALIPVGGSPLVWAPIALYLALTGSPIKAAFLAGWGVLVVGSIDNLLYPWLVGDKLRMHTVPTFFAVLGGIALFGPAGLIMGPLALALAIAFLDVWWLRTEQGQPAESAVAQEPPRPDARPSNVLQERT